MKYTIIESLVGEFEEKYKSFAKKFEKYGKASLSYSKSDVYVAETYGTKHNVSVVDIDVVGYYKIGEYEFIASCEWVESEKSNIIKSASPDVEIPIYFSTRCECDHCKTNHKRKYTVILRDTKTGEFIQVGKSCLKDFTGVNIASYAAWLSFWDSLDELQEASHRERLQKFELNYEVDDILGQAIEQSKHGGYISAKVAEDNETDSTSIRVKMAIDGEADKYGNVYYPLYEITDETREVIKAVKEFINEHEDDSVYMHNLKTLLHLKFIKWSNIGLVVSAYGTYLREVAEKEAKERKAPSEYIGTVGDKIEFTATPQCIYSTYTDWGNMYIYKFEVGSDVIIWKTSRPLSDDSITIKAKVKEHSLYNGQKQTVITNGRVK